MIAEASLILFACLFQAQPASSFVGTSTVRSTTEFAQHHGIRVSSSPARRRNHQLQQSINPDALYTDNEWHPHDPAHTTPRLLQGIWDQIANANTMVRGETMTVIYPEMQEELNKNPRFLNLIMAHLDTCKDVCDNFGITTTVVPFMDPKTRKIAGFTVKSFRNPDKQDDDEFDFAYDPLWDDGTDFDELYKGVDDEDMAKDPYPEIQDKIPDDDEKIIDITKKWVGKLMSDMGICPFTAGPETAGLPMGPVYYTIDRCATFEEMYASYWAEVVRVETLDEKELSTTLLIAPEFCMDHIELFESFTTTLTQPLAALGIEDLVQLVFFHPQWSFRDGDARASTEGQSANYARRSPWPMINILRTSQVRTAQKGIPTGLVYKQNEKTLASVGVDKLETMLRLRDWTEIADLKVNRREMDALKIAQDFQTTGAVRQEDQSLAHDATPAANRVERSQVDQGDLVNVVMQAMEKRLGKGEQSGGVVTPLSGPETSATSMATDFLLERLEDIASGGGEPEPKKADVATAKPKNEKKKETKSASKDKKSDAKASKKNVATEEKTKSKKRTDAKEAGGKEEKEKEYKETDELRKAKAARMEEARKAIFNDLREEEQKSTGRGKNQMTDVLFGGEGITKALSDEDELFQEGMNPDNFY